MTREETLIRRTNLLYNSIKFRSHALAGRAAFLQANATISPESAGYLIPGLFCLYHAEYMQRTIAREVTASLTLASQAAQLIFPYDSEEQKR